MTVRAPQASAENMSLVIELGSSELHLLSFYSAMTLETDVLTYGRTEISSQREIRDAHDPGSRLQLRNLQRIRRQHVQTDPHRYANAHDENDPAQQ